MENIALGSLLILHNIYCTVFVLYMGKPLTFEKNVLVGSIRERRFEQPTLNVSYKFFIILSKGGRVDEER